VQANQILSVDISIRADGTPVARNVLFEDPDSTDFEVEGIVTSAGSQQFTMVTLTESAMITGLTTGDVATVHYSTSSPATTFDKDLVFENSLPVGTTGLAFSVPADLIVGQEVQVQRNPTMSSGTSITADRVRLRSSRVSGIVLTGVSTLFDLSSLPSLFTIHAAPQIQQIQVETDSSSTICTVNGTVMGCSLLGFNPQHSFSVRGPLFANATTIVASKVIQH
jgi:hypothetical protein